MALRAECRSHCGRTVRETVPQEFRRLSLEDNNELYPASLSYSSYLLPWLYLSPSVFHALLRSMNSSASSDVFHKLVESIMISALVPTAPDARRKLICSLLKKVEK